MSLDIVAWVVCGVTVVGCLVVGGLFFLRREPARPRLEDAGTIMRPDDATMATLPGYFIVLEGADEKPGARKMLFSQYGEMRFGFERETREDGVDALMPNRVRIRSLDVSRRMENQGYVQYDAARGQYILYNFGNRAEGRNPITVAGRTLAPGESMTLESGMEVRIGTVCLMFQKDV